tara:strand:+ start:463 stop:1101 length:639 start_codon:yes stop_codon:yes gene_type:complete
MLNIIKEATEVITGCDITIKTRKREYVQARNLFSHFSREAGYTLEKIGEFLNKDHATIIHSLKSFQNDIETDVHFQKQHTQLQGILANTNAQKYINSSENILEAFKMQNTALAQRIIILEQELSEAVKEKPLVMEDLFKGIPKDRVQFFINNQMTTFIKMEKAVAKKRREDEYRNKKIREYKAIEQAGLKEEGGGTRESFKQPTYLSHEYRS